MGVNESQKNISNPDVKKPTKTLKGIEFGLLEVLFVLSFLFIILLSLNFLGIVSFSNLPVINQLKTAYPLEINGQKISRSDFDSMLNYVKFTQNIKDNKLAISTAVGNFEEIYILDKEATNRNITVSQNEITNTFNYYLNKNLLYDFEKDLVIKNKLTPLVVGERDGRYIVVFFGFYSPELLGLDQKSSANNIINAAYSQLKNGQSFDQVGKEINSMDEVKKLDFLQPDKAYNNYTVQSTEPLLFYSPELTDAIYKLKIGEITPVITLSNDPKTHGRANNSKDFGFAIAILDSIKNSPFNSYDAWLKDKEKNLNIKLQY